MQKDCTVFKIPNQPTQTASDFGDTRIETVKIGKIAMGDLAMKTTTSKFPYFDELNNIAEELEKCRLKML